MRRAARTDANHTEIVEALRSHGATVLSLAAVGKGCPDLMAGFRGRTLLLEVKDGSKAPSAQKLTADQLTFHANWRGGQIHVVRNVDDALAVLSWMQL